MQYTIRRLLQTIIVIIGVSFISFGLMFLTGDPTEVWLGEAADFMTQEQIDEFRRLKGFDQPWYIQYGIFVKNAVQGDFGESYRYSEPAFDVVMRRLPATVQLALIALAVSVILGVPIGVLSATRPNTGVDYASTLAALVGQSVHSFFLGIMLMLVFGVWLRVLPISGKGDWRNLLLPAFTLAAFSLARNMRLTRSSLLEVIQQDYVRTARAKGLSENTVIYLHALRNALLPLVTMVGLQLGFLLAGSVIVESIFAWPGVGRLIIDAIYNKDFAIVQAGVTVLAISFTLVNLGVDLLYSWLDPRVRYE
jgi:peptide/nickel transport system permease protein